jgi:prepilin-type N-terminal cleavage/methylation domain-containing protein
MYSFLSFLRAIQRTCGFSNQNAAQRANMRLLRTPRALPGFSMVELLMVVAIFSVISLIVLTNHSKFNSSVLLGSLAYNIGLSVREAQVYGLSVREYNSNFKVGYGIHFANPTSYFLFADVDADRRYDSGVDSIVRMYTAGQGHTLSKYCGIKVDGQRDCSDGSTSATISHLDVVFYRPDPDANISSNQFGAYSGAEITVGSPSGETRTITIASTGQIAVSSGGL